MQARFSSSLQAAADRWWLAVPVLALLMLVPALLHGHPYVFYDTAQYYEYGAKLSGFAIGKVAGAPGTPNRPAAAEPVADSKAATQAATQVEGQGEHTGIAFYGARSPFYSVWLYTFMRFLGVWAVPFTQAVAVGWLVWRLAVHTLAAHRLVWAAGATALATFGGGAWFAVAFLMPDVFAAVALAAVALLFAHADRMPLAERLGIAGLLAVSAAFHATHLVTAAVLCLAGVGVACLVGSRKVPWPAAGLVASALVLALVAQLAYNSVAWTVLGASPKRPPFAMARIIVDGPGRLYLAEHCGRDAAFAVCAYRDRPFKTTDDFLWEGEAVGGVLQTVPLAERLRLIDEEMSFVLAVAARYPFGVLRAAVANAIRQMTLVWPLEAWFDPGLLFGGGWRTARLIEAAPFIQACTARIGSCIPSLPQPAARWIIAMTVAIAFAAMAAHIAAMHRGGAADRGEDGGEDGPHRRAVVFTLLIVAGLVVNAAVCGAISNPVHRYQARVVWLAVVAAVMLEAARPIVLSRIFRRKMGKGVVGQRRFERGQESQREPSRLTGAPPG